MRIQMNNKELNYCDEIDCAWCADTNCPKTQIIVDDVDVSKCKYYHLEKCTKIGLPCSSDKNCYYKLLQREIEKNKLLQVYQKRPAIKILDNELAVQNVKYIQALRDIEGELLKVIDSGKLLADADDIVSKCLTIINEILYD